MPGTVTAAPPPTASAPNTYARVVVIIFLPL